MTGACGMVFKDSGFSGVWRLIFETSEKIFGAIRNLSSGVIYDDNDP
jgi:hypothetical protein